MINKKDLITTIAEKTGYTKKDIGIVLDATFDAIEDGMISGDGVKISGFGSFETPVRAARSGRNPQTGEKITIPEMKGIRFKPSSTLKNKIKG